MRNDLAGRFRKEGERAVATRIGELKKPTLPVWTVNQLAHREPRQMRNLVKAGKEMRTAQERAGGEKGSARLHDAIERHRESLKELVTRAEEILGESGRSASSDTVERVWGTLRAGSLEPDAQQQLLSGRLDQEIESSGFPAGLTIQASAAASRGRRNAGSSERTQRQAIRAASAEVKERQKEVQEVRKRVRELEADERRAHEAWQGTVAEADEARDALALAEESLADARERADRVR